MVKMGVIGAGRMAMVHIRGIVSGVSNVKIQAVADPYMSDATKEELNQLGIMHTYTDHRTILEDAEIQAVLIAASTDTLAALSVEALDAGKHTFCEKPVGRSIESLMPVVEAVKRHPELKYQVGFNRRFDHNFRALYDTVKKGMLGRLHFLRICSRDSVTPPQSYVRVSGGIFLDMMIHDIDLIRYFAQSDVEEVYAIGNVLIDQYFADEGDVDTAIVTMKFKNGAMGVIDNSRKAVYGYDQRAEIHGSLGCAELNNDIKNSVLVSTAEGVRNDGPVWDTLDRYVAAYRAEMRSFADAIENDLETCTSIQDSLQAVMVGLACNKSLSEKRPVKLSEIL
ncbi:MAG: inositol 2-dehydrogenase [Christensenellales bacterium]|jgi:myo-inositol 2-dehydrogenase/D-chiro-inositol 1-dehydrogenase